MADSYKNAATTTYTGDACTSTFTTYDPITNAPRTSFTYHRGEITAPARLLLAIIPRGEFTANIQEMVNWFERLRTIHGDSWIRVGDADIFTLPDSTNTITVIGNTAASVVGFAGNQLWNTEWAKGGDKITLHPRPAVVQHWPGFRSFLDIHLHFLAVLPI
jgi:hypothetical protein